MQECIFCKISHGEIKADILYQDDQIIAFNDIDPKAPYHILIIPHKHIPTMNELSKEDNQLLGHMIQSARQLVEKANIATDGYRLVFNCNRAGGQSVYHIHLHVLGGRQMHWPPG